ncbi:4'-demethylrebeccamycin synthase [Streptomyces lavendulae subsp. lavendulae]|uniref:4'-demethylrebeccamycin synthase n=1 Tax=Streptomyces lavendulae subsp. lavendulae TaxID=58340 RepID=A0A2K8PQP1_STRLA|nr:glycosyltransferase [Streptomyces lavendulae]ATZ29029.1 4'-demethylrebeccamycin synthase [Streptomyces lavendulae subsp. lavendulae]QUQ58850.1 O-mycaminosyltylonolide 6-deoxyallosyltransferase [Streptomyces lavendulae subsp. lavendulae]
MRILIATAGSRGDVAPYTGLGVALSRAGHEVALAATGTFEPLATEAGLEFRPLPADHRAHGSARGKRELLRAAAAFVTDLGEGFAGAVDRGTDVLLLSATTAPLGWHVAEAAGTPSMGVYLQPTTPTGDFPPTVTGTRSLGRLGNRAAGRFALHMADRVFEPAVARLRARLDLPPLTAARMRRRQAQARWPVLHGFSTALLPRPSDWAAGLAVTGPWWPYVGADRRLPAELEDFLAAGPPPVLVGFGSMAAGEGERLGEIAVRALRRAGLRGVLQSGSAGLAADADDVLTVGDLPHALLFPRLAAVVHHAGAGTAAAALRAGVPSVTVPVTADQPFWAGRLAAVGAAPVPIPFRSLTAEGLGDALAKVVREPSYAAAAAAAARHIAVEDGEAALVSAVGRLIG